MDVDNRLVWRRFDVQAHDLLDASAQLGRELLLGAVEVPAHTTLHRVSGPSHERIPIAQEHPEEVPKLIGVRDLDVVTRELLILADRVVTQID